MQVNARHSDPIKLKYVLVKDAQQLYIYTLHSRHTPSVLNYGQHVIPK